MAAEGLQGVAMTIGAVSRATGIPASTLRTWERRYGYPSPMRTDGGQRLYPPEVVPHLRLAARALDAGSRPREVLGIETDQLRLLVEAHSGPVPRDLSSNARGLVTAAHRLDADALWAGFYEAYGRLGGLGFATECAYPFVFELGEAWARGDIDVSHEHFASEQLRSFLAATWRPMSDRSTGPTVVCACLPGERHDLGLAMASLVLAIAGWRVIYLGANTPIDSILAAVAQVHARAVAASVSPFVDRQEARSALTTLRARLPSAVHIVVGGTGAPDDIGDIVVKKDLAELDEWARSVRDGG